MQAQTALNWQLVLVDASDDAHPDVAKTVQARAAQDKRIVYAKIENKGIAANTNEGRQARHRGLPWPWPTTTICWPPRRLLHGQGPGRETAQPSAYSDEGPV